MDHLCVYPGCTDEIEDESLCAAHLKMKQEYPQAHPCLVPSCRELSFNGMYCEDHEEIFTLTGSPVKAKEFCGIPGCEDLHVLKGMCQKHYAQWMRAYERFSGIRP
jgi:hypothetical protein